MQEPHSHIVSDPEIAFGKPRIAGTRFSVKDVVIIHLMNGMPLELISGEYDLPLASVYAAMSYYYDHKQEMDRAIEESDAFVDEFRAEWERSHKPRLVH